MTQAQIPSSWTRQTIFHATYTLPKAMLGYDKGYVLKDVSLTEVRSMECNRCGDCCDSSRPDVKLDPDTGLPLWVWGSNLPHDRYRLRFGEEMVKPLIRGDSEMVEAKDFEYDADNKPHRSFRCRFLLEEENGQTRCAIYEQPEPERRPLNCGSFPVFGLELDDAILDHGFFILPTGALPRCTWYGIRAVGPWKNTRNWRRLWVRQQRKELYGA